MKRPRVGLEVVTGRVALPRKTASRDEADKPASRKSDRYGVGPEEVSLELQSFDSARMKGMVEDPHTQALPVSWPRYMAIRKSGERVLAPRLRLAAERMPRLRYNTIN